MVDTFPYKIIEKNVTHNVGLSEVEMPGLRTVLMICRNCPGGGWIKDVVSPCVCRRNQVMS